MLFQTLSINMAVIFKMHIENNIKNIHRSYLSYTAVKYFCKEIGYVNLLWNSGLSIFDMLFVDTDTNKIVKEFLCYLYQ